MKQTITFKIEVDHPTPLKPEGEFRGRKTDDYVIGLDGSNTVTQSKSNCTIPHLIVYPQPSAAEELADFILDRHFVDMADMARATALARRIKSEVRP